MKTLIIIFMLATALPALAFEAEDQPVTQKEFEAHQKKQAAKVSKYPAVPSAKHLFNNGKNGTKYSMSIFGGGMLGFGCKSKSATQPRAVCESDYVPLQTGWDNKEGSGRYRLECYKKKVCAALDNAKFQRDALVEVTVQFDGITELTGSDGTVRRVPVLIADDVE